MKFGLWSQTAAANSATPPDGWPEGQAPSTVNDCAREMMAAIAVGIQDIQFIDLGMTPTQTSGNTFTVSGSYADVLTYGRRLKIFDGANTLYATVISATATAVTGVTLRFDAGNAPLDSSLSSFAIGSPSGFNGAVPEQVFRRKNYFINPLFDIWQRGSGPYSLSSGTVLYTADRWKVSLLVSSSGPVLSVTQGERSAAASNVPTLAQAGVFLNNCITISCNAALAGVSATDAVFLQQAIEGYNYRNLAGKPITLQFWVNSQVTGTYCVALVNTGGNQSQVMQYSISSVATWEKKTINFIKPPAAGTWDYSTGIGLNVRFALAAGTNFQVGSGNWTAVNALATNAQTNFLAAANKTIKFAAMQIEEGNNASPVEPFDFETEVGKCQRYCQVIPGSGSGTIMGAAGNTTNLTFLTDLQSPMRVTPSANFPALSQMNIQNFAGTVVSVSSVGAISGNNRRIAFGIAAVGAPLTSTLPYMFYVSAGSQIVLDAEL